MQWAVMHPAETLEDAESFTSRVHLAGADDQAVALAGPGAPLVAEFSVAEFAAAIGVGTEAGKHYLGHAVELRYRLPRLWARVVAGDLAAWKARRVARETISHALSREAAGFVDRHVAPVAHKVSPARVDRLVAEAVGRFMPEVAERRRREAADGRFFRVDHEQVSFAGTSLVTGELDLADALDLDDAIRGIAAQLGDLGSTEPLDVRRSVAAGELARRQLALDLTTETPARTRRRSRPRRQRTTSRTVLHLHLSHAALTSLRPGRAGGEHPHPGHRRADPCLVRPPRDRAGGQAGDRPRRPRPRRGLRGPRPDRRTGRAARPHLCLPLVHPPRPSPGPGHVSVRLRPRHPLRRRPAARHLHPCRLAPLCRRHHRLKTHSAWTYTILEPGSYLWSSPHGYHYLRDHHGTLDVSPDRTPPTVPGGHRTHRD